jgi:hypothetical protein
MLKALYSRYRLKPAGGGLRPKALRLDGWLALMGDAGLVDAQFTLSDATLAFLWSRMHVIDEVKDYGRWGRGFLRVRVWRRRRLFGRGSFDAHRGFLPVRRRPSPPLPRARPSLRPLPRPRLALVNPAAGRRMPFDPRPPRPNPRRHTSLTFTDFLEALGRVADAKSLPTASDLADAGYSNILEWWVPPWGPPQEGGLWGRGVLCVLGCGWGWWGERGPESGAGAAQG